MRQFSKVKWFNNRSGFGFLEPLAAGGDDIAIHYSEIEKVFPDERVCLEEGDEISFVLERHPRGLRAARARRVQENGNGHG